MALKIKVFGCESNSYTMFRIWRAYYVVDIHRLLSAPGKACVQRLSAINLMGGLLIQVKKLHCQQNLHCAHAKIARVDLIMHS